MKNNQLQLVTDEQAQKLNDLGMDTDVSCYVYKENIEWETRKFKPTIQQAFLWLRNEKGIIVSIKFCRYTEYEIKTSAYSGDNEHYMYEIFNRKDYTYKDSEELKHRTFEDCELTALNKALDHLPL